MSVSISRNDTFAEIASLTQTFIQTFNTLAQIDVQEDGRKHAREEEEDYVGAVDNTGNQDSATDQVLTISFEASNESQPCLVGVFFLCLVHVTHPSDPHIQ